MIRGRLSASFLLLFTPIIFAESAVRGELRFVRTGTTERASRITFENVGFPDARRANQYDTNPIIQGDNLYAPDLLRVGDAWYCYYGGWKTTGQLYDRIYLGISSNLEPKGPWGEQMIISNGIYEHVNDPTVYRDGSSWIMLYTAAMWTGSGPSRRFRDWINYSTSTNGTSWTPNAGTASTEITMMDPSNILQGAAFSDLARPSLVRDGSKWKLWFDGRLFGETAVRSYLAESTGVFPSSFQLVHKYADVPGFPGFMEPDVVRRADGTFSAVIQRHFKKLYYGTSTDGITFTLSEVVDADHPFFIRKYVSNPGLIYDQTTDQILGFSFGMTDNDGLTDHDIGFSAAQYVVEVRSPGPVGHGFMEAHGLDELSVIVFDYTTFDQVRLKDPITNQLLVTQDFTGARVGDLWSLVDTAEVADWSLY